MKIAMTIEILFLDHERQQQDYSCSIDLHSKRRKLAEDIIKEHNESNTSMASEGRCRSIACLAENRPLMVLEDVGPTVKEEFMRIANGGWSLQLIVLRSTAVVSKYPQGGWRSSLLRFAWKFSSYISAAYCRLFRAVGNVQPYLLPNLERKRTARDSFPISLNCFDIERTEALDTADLKWSCKRIDGENQSRKVCSLGNAPAISPFMAFATGQ